MRFDAWAVPHAPYPSVAQLPAALADLWLPALIPWMAVLGSAIINSVLRCHNCDYWYTFSLSPDWEHLSPTSPSPVTTTEISVSTSVRSETVTSTRTVTETPQPSECPDASGQLWLFKSLSWFLKQTLILKISETWFTWCTCHHTVSHDYSPFTCLLPLSYFIQGWGQMHKSPIYH